MDKSTHERWWPLHMKSVKGEPLTDEERRLYETGLNQLQEEEVLSLDWKRIAKLRAQIAAMEIERAQLEEESRKLNAEIASLDALLQERVGQVLTVED